MPGVVGTDLEAEDGREDDEAGFKIVLGVVADVAGFVVIVVAVVFVIVEGLTAEGVACSLGSAGFGVVVAVPGVLRVVVVLGVDAGFVVVAVAVLMVVAVVVLVVEGLVDLAVDVVVVVAVRTIILEGFEIDAEFAGLDGDEFEGAEEAEVKLEVVLVEAVAVVAVAVV